MHDYFQSILIRDNYTYNMKKKFLYTYLYVGSSQSIIDGDSRKYATFLEKSQKE